MSKERLHDAPALNKLKTLSWLPPERLERLSAHIQLLKVRKRQVICYEREASNRLYLMLSGVAKLTFLSPQSERVLVSLLGPGEIFGVSSLLPQTQRSFRADAFFDCVVGIIKPDEFVALTLGTNLDDFSHMMEITVGRWWNMLLRYVNFVGSSLRQRLAATLLELALKFGARESRGVMLTLNVTHGDLAELVGASRQRITEQLNEFERQGIITRQGRRLILLDNELTRLISSHNGQPT